MYRALLCILSTTVVALVNQAAAYDPVDAIEATYADLADFRAEFTQQTIVEALGKTVANRGTLAVRKPGLLRMEFAGQPQRQYISDGKQLWIYSPGDNQYQVMPLGGASLPREALTFLNGFGELRRHFIVEPYAPPKKERGHIYLGLRPRGSAGYRLLTCDFEARGPMRHLLVALTIYGATGNQTHYRFSNFSINSGLSPDLFRFVPPDGARKVRIAEPSRRGK
ncbi:MAG: outer membrane lipoprotein carrier protein LolA [Deltaproteobacteria bacterium]|nr:outer membrane lipoprotein carrier protein LolA [Deltaproteobacteria bacterium]